MTLMRNAWRSHRNLIVLVLVYRSLKFDYENDDEDDDEEFARRATIRLTLI